MPTRFYIFLGILLALDVYAFMLVNTAVRGLNPVLAYSIRILYWVVSISLFAFLIIGVNGAWDHWSPGFRALQAGLWMSLIVPKAILLTIAFSEDIVRLTKWAVQFFQNSDSSTVEGTGKKITRSVFLARAAVAAAAVPFLVSGYGILRGAYNYNIKKITLKFPHLPAAFDGFKVVQFSDLHAGSLYNKKPLEHAVQLMNDLKPDAIFFTGDLVNAIAKEMDPLIPIFSQLKAKHGVFSVAGNHDYGVYAYDGDDPRLAENWEYFLQVHKNLGWDLLLNENRLIKKGEDSLAIVGVENTSRSHHFLSKGDLNKALTGSEDASVKLLMSHDPSHWKMEITDKFPQVDATFSGHTHGFQVGIDSKLGKWSPVQYVYDQWSGLYEHANNAAGGGKQYIYVNVGLGFVGYPGRLGISPEITEFTLKKA